MLARRFRTPLHLPLALAAAVACSGGERGAAGDSAAAPPATAEATPSAAEATQAGPITAAELRAHRLTMERVRDMHRKHLAVIRLQPKMSESNDDDSTDQNGEFDVTRMANNMLRHIQRNPSALAALRQVGSTPREFAVHMGALVGASLASAGAPSPAASPENAAFVKANQAELRRLDQERADLEKSLRKDDDPADEPASDDTTGSGGQ